MNLWTLTLSLIGGLGLFLFGVKTMSEGLKKVASNRLKNLLHFFTRNALIAVLVGAAVTCLIQSSSATTVMTIGFVNAGLLTLKQAIGVVMGANIGTTFTAWLVSLISISAFKITRYALPAIGIGFAMISLCKTKKYKSWGGVLLGFGILFLGLSIMKDAFEPLKKSDAVKDFFVNFSRYPILGILAGTVVTMLLQSSSATIAIVQVMAFNGLLSFESAIPLILGDNIGTTITALLASLGTNDASRQTAKAHMMFNVLGVCYMLPLVYLGIYSKAIKAIIPGSISTSNIMMYVAVSHSVFNVFNTLVFLPLTGILEKVAVKLTKKSKQLVAPTNLEKHLLAADPSMAISQAVKETIRMANLAHKSINDAMNGFFDDDMELLRAVREHEDVIDRFQYTITAYLVELSEQTLTDEESKVLPALIHSINDLERIGDHAENVMELSERKIEQNLQFTGYAILGIRKMFNEAEQMMTKVISALENNDQDVAHKALTHEDVLNKMEIQLRENHIQRLQEGQCDMLSGVIFLDLINNIDKIGDHLKNIALAITQGRI